MLVDEGKHHPAETTDGGDPMINNSGLKRNLTGGMLVGALASVAFVVPALSAAPAAHATCASFFGIGNSAQCSSTFGNIAFALGVNAEAHADGLLPFGAAFAFGDGALAQNDAGFSLAATVGANSHAIVELGAANVALNLSGDGTTVDVAGLGNLAVNLFADNSTVQAGFILPGNVAFNAFGSGNTVNTYVGGLSVAASILQKDATVTASTLGLNVNGLKIGGLFPTTADVPAAAGRTVRKFEPRTATASLTGSRPSAPVPTARKTGNTSKKASPAAASVRHSG